MIRKPPAGPILAVDTTERPLSLALQTQKGILASTREPRKPHDETIHAAAERLLAKAGLRARELSAVAVAAGPGTFTGIRVGMAYAAMLSFELHIPALALSRLEALAFASPHRRTLAAIEGFRGEVYCQPFHITRGAPRPEASPLWLRPAEWPAYKAAALRRGLVLAEGRPGARDLLAPAAIRLAREHRPPFEPLYLKPANYELSRR